MFNIGGGEFMVIALIALIVLGPQRLPDAARQVGKAVGEIRRISAGFQNELRGAMNESATPATPARDALGADRAGTDGASPASAHPARPARKAPLKAAPAKKAAAPKSTRPRSKGP